MVDHSAAYLSAEEYAECGDLDLHDPRLLPFMGVQSIIAITGSLIYVILSIIVSETEVGFFNAATQVITPSWLLSIESIVIAGFPMLCQRFRTGLPALRNACLIG